MFQIISVLDFHHCLYRFVDSVILFICPNNKHDIIYSIFIAFAFYCDTKFVVGFVKNLFNLIKLKVLFSKKGLNLFFHYFFLTFLIYLHRIES